MNREKIYIYGKHALHEALLSFPRAVLKVFLAEDKKEPKILEMLAKFSIPSATLKTNSAPGLAQDISHQGVVATIDPSAIVRDAEDFFISFSPTPHSMFILLDGVHDPHNCGAIIRSAVAFGSSGVILPRRGQAGLTGAVIKSSAGMAFRIPLLATEDARHALNLLKKKGFSAYAFAMDGDKKIFEEKFSSPTVFILGNEAMGVSAETRALCDTTLSIPISKRAESLNVAAATAVGLYAWSLQNPSATQ